MRAFTVYAHVTNFLTPETFGQGYRQAQTLKFWSQSEVLYTRLKWLYYILYLIH